MVFCFLIPLTGCRKANRSSRARRTRVETTMKPSEQEMPAEKNVVEQPESRSKTPLTGAEIFKRYENAVFMIYTFDDTYIHQGSGFFIGADGLAVSNYHVFEGTNIGKELIKLANDNSRSYKINSILYESKEHDCIIFRVDYQNSIYIPISDSKPSIGDKVYAIGSPRGLENTFSSGEVSQWRSGFLMQISALIDHGSSGGALINEYGKAVGITSGTLYDGSQANLNYAMSIDVIKGHF